MNAVDDLAMSMLFTSQVGLLNQLALKSYREPMEALAQLTEKLPTNKLHGDLLWLWHAVFFQCASHIRDEVVERRRTGFEAAQTPDSEFGSH